MNVPVSEFETKAKPVSYCCFQHTELQERWLGSENRGPVPRKATVKNYPISCFSRLEFGINIYIIMCVG